MPGQLGGGLDAADSDHVGGGAEAALAGIVLEPYRVECPCQCGVQLLPDAIQAPTVVLEVLHPLEVAHGDAAGVGENVGQYLDATSFQNFVRIRLGRSVGGLNDDRCPDRLGI